MIAVGRQKEESTTVSVQDRLGLFVLMMDREIVEDDNGPGIDLGDQHVADVDGSLSSGQSMLTHRVKSASRLVRLLVGKCRARVQIDVFHLALQNECGV